jgi:dsDNA-specific endonuclease/ATPase MutS2
MESRFRTGELVQTPLGKGVVREVRTNGRVVVEINGRAVVLEEAAAAPLESRKRSARRQKPARRHAAKASRDTGPPEPAPRVIARRASGLPKRLSVPVAETDLHGLTVEEALARTEQALNDALLADLPELRLIHGKSSGRIRAALHRRLREITTVRAFRLDPRNAGVTIVSL